MEVPSKHAPPCTLTGHSKSVSAVAWSLDARWLVSGADDNSIIVWDATTRKTVLGRFSEGDTKTKDEAALQDLVRKLLEPDREQRMKHFDSNG